MHVCVKSCVNGGVLRRNSWIRVYVLGFREQVQEKNVGIGDFGFWVQGLERIGPGTIIGVGDLGVSLEV
jgi:hypothetical protein